MTKAGTFAPDIMAIARAEGALRRSPVTALDRGGVSWREPGWFDEYFGKGLRWRGAHYSDLKPAGARAMAEELDGEFGRAAGDLGVDLARGRPSRLYRGLSRFLVRWHRGVTKGG